MFYILHFIFHTFVLCFVSTHTSVLCPTLHYAILYSILKVNDAKKDTSSTAGMGASVATSPLLLLRAKHVVEGRMAAIEKAFKVCERVCESVCERVCERVCESVSESVSESV